MCQTYFNASGRPHRPPAKGARSYAVELANGSQERISAIYFLQHKTIESEKQFLPIRIRPRPISF